MLYSIVALLVVILDQAVKYWVTNTLMGADIVKFIPGVISLVNVPNDGAAFSLLSGGGARIYFIIVTVVFCVAVILALATNFISGRVARWSLVMVAAGGFANCIDRVIYGYVVDMFKVELFNFAIFNVADIFITVFAIVFALAVIFEKPQKDEDEDDYDDEDEEDEAEEDAGRKRPLFARFRRSDEEDEEEERPRRGKKAKYEEEYQEYKTQQRPSRPAAPARTREPAAPVKPAPQAQAPRTRAAAPVNNDPFAEWERANAKVDAQRAGSYAARAMDVPVQPQARPSAAQQPAYRPPVQRPAQQAAPQSAAPAEPAVRPSAPQPKPAAPASTEFDLDDILNEFK
ncbi:MAG: signal peptidase II [Candidatus Limivicinus sp.]